MLGTITFGLFAATALEAAEGRKGWRKRSPEKIVKRLDTDGDGKLTLEIFVAKSEGKRKERREKIFRRSDNNENLFVTLDELKARDSKGKKKCETFVSGYMKASFTFPRVHPL